MQKNILQIYSRHTTFLIFKLTTIQIDFYVRHVGIAVQS